MKSFIVTLQITEQFLFPVVSCGICTIDEILWCWQAIYIGLCFPVVLFTLLYKVFLSFKSKGDILKCYHSEESS